MVLTFHGNCLLRRQLHEISKPISEDKSKKNINLSSAEFVHRVVNVKFMDTFRLYPIKSDWAQQME